MEPSLLNLLVNDVCDTVPQIDVWLNDLGIVNPGMLAILSNGNSGIAVDKWKARDVLKIA